MPFSWRISFGGELVIRFERNKGKLLTKDLKTADGLKFTLTGEADYTTRKSCVITLNVYICIKTITI